MKELLKQAKAATNAARDLYFTLAQVNTALYLDLLLLEAEAELGLMDGMEVIKDGQ